MKKVVVIVFVLGCFFQSFSQEEKAKTKSKSFFGVKAGFNVIHSSSNDDKPFSFGIQLGTTLTIPMSKRFSFQPEVLLQTANTTSRYQQILSINAGFVQERTTKNTFLLFPLNFKYTISKKVDIDLGPTIGYRLNYDSKVVETTTYSNGRVEVFEFDPTAQSSPYGNSKPNNLALAANLGVNYNFTEKIHSGFRYSLFVDEFQTLNSTIDNSLFAFSVGYSFK